jgi:hypothetical protein
MMSGEQSAKTDNHTVMTIAQNLLLAENEVTIHRSEFM